MCVRVIRTGTSRAWWWAVLETAELVGTLSKVGVTAIIRMTNETMTFFLKPAKPELCAHASIRMKDYFDKADVRSRAENTIALDVNLANLARALESAEGSSIAGAVLKLTSRQKVPYFTVLVRVRDSTVLPSGAKRSRFLLITSALGSFKSQDHERQTAIEQNVPVEIISQARASELEEPLLVAPLARVSSIDHHLLSTVVDRIRTVSDRLMQVQVQPSQHVKLHVETEEASVSTFFSDCSLESPISEPVACTVSVRDFATLLAACKVEFVENELVLSPPSSLAYLLMLPRGAGHILFVLSVFADEDPDEAGFSDDGRDDPQEGGDESGILNT